MITYCNLFTYGPFQSPFWLMSFVVSEYPGYCAAFVNTLISFLQISFIFTCWKLSEVFIYLSGNGFWFVQPLKGHGKSHLPITACINFMDHLKVKTQLFCYKSPGHSNPKRE